MNAALVASNNAIFSNTLASYLRFKFANLNIMTAEDRAQAMKH